MMKIWTPFFKCSLDFYCPPRLGDDKTGLGAFLHVCSHSRCDIESIYMYHVACLYTAYTYIFILALASIKTGRSQHLRSREA